MFKILGLIFRIWQIADSIFLVFASTPSKMTVLFSRKRVKFSPLFWRQILKACFFLFIIA